MEVGGVVNLHATGGGTLSLEFLFPAFSQCDTIIKAHAQTQGKFLFPAFSQCDTIIFPPCKIVNLFLFPAFSQCDTIWKSD